MKKLVIFISICAVIFFYDYFTHKSVEKNSHYILLSADKVNKVKINDTLLIAESTCRGCEYEHSTRFDVTDSMDLLKLIRIETTDNSPDNMDGGSIDKDLILIPVKTGNTIIKQYRFYGEEISKADSSKYKSYNIQIIK